MQHRIPQLESLKRSHNNIQTFPTPQRPTRRKPERATLHTGLRPPKLVVHPQRHNPHIRVKLTEQFNIMLARDQHLIILTKPPHKPRIQNRCLPHRKHNSMLTLHPPLTNIRDRHMNIHRPPRIQHHRLRQRPFEPVKHRPITKPGIVIPSPRLDIHSATPRATSFSTSTRPSTWAAVSALASNAAAPSIPRGCKPFRLNRLYAGISLSQFFAVLFVSATLAPLVVVELAPNEIPATRQPKHPSTSSDGCVSACFTLCNPRILPQPNRFPHQRLSHGCVRRGKSWRPGSCPLAGFL